jgi:two-component system, chemotaxis family, protein-glutamate methylesterase/glutaminase
VTALRAAADPRFSKQRPGADYDLVVIGASLGGLQALRTLLGGLPREFPAAVAIVQHRRPDADSALAHLLGSVSPLPVCEPHDRERIEPGTVYLAPPGYHLLVDGGQGRPGREGAAVFAGGGGAEPGWLTLSVEGPVSWARPSIDVLFESAAEAYRRRLAAVLLTGSSEDGAAGIEAVAKRGGLTVVEDPGSAHSPVSPRAALQRTTVHHVLPLGDIAGFLREMVQSAARR